MTRSLVIAGMLLLANSAAAERIIPVSRPAGIFGTHEIRLRNVSRADAATVTLEYDADGHTAGIAPPIRLGPGAEIVLPDVVRTLFGMTPETTGEIRVQGPENIEVHWRAAGTGPAKDAWQPSIATTGHTAATAVTRRRRAVCFGCRVDPPTLVKVNDITTFAGSHNVSGTATIIDKSTIRVSGLRHDGSAPGLDFRIGLSTNSRQDFVVLRATGRQAFQNATFDLTLPQGVDLNAFDTFTVWCYEFVTIIAEGKFKRP